VAAKRKKKPGIKYGQLYTNCKSCRCSISSGSPYCVPCRELVEGIKRKTEAEALSTKRRRELEHRRELERIEREIYGF